MIPCENIVFIYDVKNILGNSKPAGLEFNTFCKQ